MPLVAPPERGVGEGPETLETTVYGGGLVLERLQWPVRGHSAFSDIWYVDQDENTLRFNDLLPPDVVLKKDLSILGGNYDAMSKKIAYSDRTFDVSNPHVEEDFWKPGGFLCLLHEVGHSVLDNENLVIQSEIRDRIFEAQWREVGFEDGDFSIGMDILRIERRAWAYAISAVRSLREKGIDLEPELPSIKDMLPVIHGPLGTYDESIMRAFLPDDEVLDNWLSDRYKYRKLAAKGVPQYLARHAIRPSKGLPSELITSE